MTVPASALRTTLRDRRRGLSSTRQHQASQGLWRQLRSWAVHRQAGCAAVYAATDGEVDPQIVAQELRKLGWTTAYPRVVDEQMVFASVAFSTDLVEGRWGLLEPADACMDVAMVEIDVVFTPLVAFDAAGNRLGRGKGFYDRAFAQTTSSPTRPAQLRIGLAHDFQLVQGLTPQPHDVPLHAVVTPTQRFGSLDR